MAKQGGGKQRQCPLTIFKLMTRNLLSFKAALEAKFFKNTLKEGTPVEACWEEVRQNKGIHLGSVIRSRMTRNRLRMQCVALREYTPHDSLLFNDSGHESTNEEDWQVKMILPGPAWALLLLWEIATIGLHYRLFSLLNNLLDILPSFLLIVGLAAQETRGKYGRFWLWTSLSWWSNDQLIHRPAIII